MGFGSEPTRSGRGISSWFLGTIFCSQPRFSPRSFALVEETSPKMKAAASVSSLCVPVGQSSGSSLCARRGFHPDLHFQLWDKHSWAQLNFEAAAKMCVWVKKSFVCPKLGEDSAQWPSGVCAKRSWAGFGFTDIVSWSIWETLWQHPCAFYLCCL